jgi:hypothetical protein
LAVLFAVLAFSIGASSFAEEWRWPSSDPQQVNVTNDTLNINPVDTVVVANPDFAMDDVGGAITIDFVHHEVHEGEYYTAMVRANDVDAADTLFIYFKTGASSLHFAASISCPYAGVAAFYETPTVTDTTGMSNITPRCNNRVTGDLAGEIVGWSDSDLAFIDIATANLGTRLESAYVGAGAGAKAAGGTARQGTEWILKANTIYMIIFVSSTNDNDVHVGIGYYVP